MAGGRQSNGVPAEVLEEARAKKEREEAERQQQMRGWMDMLNPFSGGFSFVNLLMFAALAFGVYWTATTDKGKELFGDISSKLGEWFSGAKDWFASTFPDLAANFAPEEVQKAEANNPGATKQMMQIANELGVSATAPFDDADKAPEVLFRALTNPLTGNYLRDIVREGKGKSVDPAMQNKVLGAASRMLADPQKLKALLAPGQRANTFALLEAASPIPFAPGRLGAFITKIGIDPHTGEPTALLNQTIQALLDDDTTARTQALKNLLTRIDQPTAKALFEGIDTAQVPAEYRGLITQAQGATKDAQTYAQAQALAQAAPNGVLDKLAAANANGPAGLLSLVAQDKETRDFLRSDAMAKAPFSASEVQAIRFIRESSDREITALSRVENHFAAQGASFMPLIQDLTRPQAGNKPASSATMADRVVDLMLDPQKRGLFMDGGVTRELATIITEESNKPTVAAAQRPYMRFLGHVEGGQAWNLNLTLKLAQRVGDNPANRQNPHATRNVLSGLIGLMTGDTKLAARLRTDQLAAFMKAPGNAETIGAYLRSLKVDDLPPEQQKAVRTLAQHWGNANEGLAEVLADDASIRTIVALTRNPPAAMGAPGDWGLGSIVTGIGKGIFWNISGATSVMAENRAHLEAMMTLGSELRQAGVGAGGGAAIPRLATIPAQRS